MSEQRTKTIDEMLRMATKEAKQEAKLSDTRHKLVTKFLDNVKEDWGIGPDQFARYVKTTLDTCLEKQDVKTAEKLLDMWYNLMLAPNNNVKNLLSGASALNRIEAKYGGKKDSEEGGELDAETSAPTPEEELAMIDAQLAEEEPSIDC